MRIEDILKALTQRASGGQVGRGVQHGDAGVLHRAEGVGVMTDGTPYYWYDEGQHFAIRTLTADDLDTLADTD